MQADSRGKRVSVGNVGVLICASWINGKKKLGRGRLVGGGRFISFLIGPARADKVVDNMTRLLFRKLSHRCALRGSQNSQDERAKLNFLCFIACHSALVQGVGLIASKYVCDPTAAKIGSLALAVGSMLINSSKDVE